MQKMWVATMPGPGAALEDCVFETDVLGLARAGAGAAGSGHLAEYAGAEFYPSRAEALAGLVKFAEATAGGYDDLATAAALAAAVETGPDGPRPEGRAGEAWDFMIQGMQWPCQTTAEPCAPGDDPLDEIGEAYVQAYRQIAAGRKALEAARKDARQAYLDVAGDQ